jgi:four helix bundle protein
MSGKNYRDLIVWQKAMDFVVEAYQASRVFPKEEMYCLTSQLRRAVISIPSNIAEGQGRRTPKEFGRFLDIARGSLRESETQIMIAQRLDYIDAATMNALLDRAGEVGRLANGLSNSLPV